MHVMHAMHSCRCTSIVHARTHVRACVHVCMCACVHVYMCACVHVCVQRHILVCAHASTRVRALGVCVRAWYSSLVVAPSTMSSLKVAIPFSSDGCDVKFWSTPVLNLSNAVRGLTLSFGVLWHMHVCACQYPRARACMGDGVPGVANERSDNYTLDRLQVRTIQNELRRI